MQSLADQLRCVLLQSLLLFTQTINLRLKFYKQSKTNTYLSTMDLLVPATMKNAAKRDM